MPDFAGGKLVVQDAYLDVRYSDVFKLRFGKMKVPFGLERLQDERSTTFTERGLPTQVAPNRDLGVQAFGELAEARRVPGSASSTAWPMAERRWRRLERQGGRGTRVRHADSRAGRRRRRDLRREARPPRVARRRVIQDAWSDDVLPVQAGTTVLDTVFADGRHWRAAGQAYSYTGPFGLLGEYVRSRQHIKLGGKHELADLEAWQVVGQWVITGENATYKSVTPNGKRGAFDVTARVGELRVVDAGTLDNGFADPTKSARRAWSAGIGGDWFANRAVRFVLDVDRTWYTRGAKTGDRPAETSIIGRAQLAF